MERTPSRAVDELAGIDLSTWSDAAIADEFVALRRDLDRLEAVAARLLVGVHDRLVPFGEGASSTPAWAQWRAGQRFQDAKASLDAGFACAQLALMAKAWGQGAQRRADGLVRIWRRFLDLEDLAVEAGEAPHLSLTISWETIQSWLPCPTAPADLAGALSKHEIHRLLCDVNIARIVLGPDSQPLDVGREYRTAPRWLRRAVGKRDGGCRYPGCDRRPNRCEVHHVWPWETGGPTSIANCVLLCSFHHHVVHRRDWTNQFDGITYTVHNQHDITIE